MPGSAPVVLFVTGKGGVGKSYISRQIARGAELAGLRTRMVATAPIRITAERESDVDESPEVVYLDPRRSLAAFLRRIVRLDMLSRRLMDSRTFSAVAAAAPGLTDLVTLAAITSMASDAAHLDLLVVDAPASGHSLPLLAAPRRVLDIAPLGPVARLARESLALVSDASRTRVVVVTTAEELAVTEALELLAGLRDIGVRPARPVVNGLYSDYLDETQAHWVVEHGASPDALLHRQRRRRQLALVERFSAQAGRPFSIAFRFATGDDGREVARTLWLGLSEELAGP